jgi:hypothetical protein
MHETSVTFNYAEESDGQPIAYKFNNEAYSSIKNVSFECLCPISAGENMTRDYPGSPTGVEGNCDIIDIIITLQDEVEVDYWNEDAITDPIHKAVIRDIYEAYQSYIDQKAVDSVT